MNEGGRRFDRGKEQADEHASENACLCRKTAWQRHREYSHDRPCDSIKNASLFHEPPLPKSGRGLPHSTTQEARESVRIAEGFGVRLSSAAFLPISQAPTPK